MVWKKTFVRLLGLGLLATLLLATEAGFAQKRSTTPRRTTMTDAAGRTHTRGMNRVSDAQRKAAAKHLQALRAKHAPGGKKNGGKR